MPKSVVSCQLSVVSSKSSVNREPVTVNRKSAGFTLIELLVVMTIIAILLAVGSFSWLNAQQKGRDGKRKSDIKATQQALETYYQKNGKYPASSSGQIVCNADGDSTPKSWGSPFTCGTTTYMDKLPTELNQTNKYYYSSSGSGPFNYILSADFENNNDPDRITTGIPCTPQGYPTSGYDFCVNNP